ncbi:hypothetical protein JCM10450v2_007933 [Rhodotorula kratochvilovae]
MPFGIPRSQPPRPIVPPPVPPSKLPQYVAPTPLSRASQIASFAFATDTNNTVQVRRWVDAHTASLFTLSAQDRQVLSAQRGVSPAAPGAAEAQAQVQPDRRTPVAFFKENPVLGKEGEKEVGKEGKAV